MADESDYPPSKILFLRMITPHMSEGVIQYYQMCFFWEHTSIEKDEYIEDSQMILNVPFTCGEIDFDNITFEFSDPTEKKPISSFIVYGDESKISDIARFISDCLMKTILTPWKNVTKIDWKLYGQDSTSHIYVSNFWILLSQQVETEQKKYLNEKLNIGFLSEISKYLFKSEMK